MADPDLSVHDSLPGDRYLLCSDGLSGVVSDETLRDTLSTIEDPETATRQLIDLAIHGGGPDNITCIVADVVDTATSRLPPTTIPVLAGAAATLGDLRLADGSGPFGGFEDHHEDHVLPARTAPQPAADDLDPMMTSAVMPLTVSENGADPRAARARRSHRAQPRRRRWPIVSTALVVLVAVIIGGGYIFWRVSQSQYYVGADNGQVAIYRGINYHILGISLSSLYKPTGIQLAQVPSNDQQLVQTAGSTGSLTQMNQTVASIGAAIDDCHSQYTMWANWVTKDNKYQTYQAKVAAARRKHPTGSIANLGPPPPNPGLQPFTTPDQRATGVGGTCPPSTEFNISVSALTPAAPGSS
jgi:protein phosphatase